MRSGRIRTTAGAAMSGRSGAWDSALAVPARLCSRYPVVDVDERVDGVDVGRQPEGRLRFAVAEHLLRLQPAEDRAGRLPHRLAGLGEDVVRVAVTGVGQRLVGSGSAFFVALSPTAWADTPTQA